MSECGMRSAECGARSAERGVLLEIDDLHVRFDTDDGVVRAVTGVSLRLERGEVLGLVGESGFGKTAGAMAVARLLPVPPGRIAGGRILFEDRDVLTLPPRELRELRGAQIGRASCRERV